MKKLILYALTVVAFALILALPTVLLAQAGATGPPGVTDPATLGLKIVVIAGVVSTVLQGVKRLFPAIQGNLARAVAVISAIAAAYAAVPPEGVLSFMFALQVLGTAFATLGIHGLAKGG